MKLYRISFRDKYRREIQSMEVKAPMIDIAFAIAQDVAISIKGCTSMAANPIREELAYVN